MHFVKLSIAVSVRQFCCTFVRFTNRSATRHPRDVLRAHDYLTMSIVTAHSDCLANYLIARKNPTPPCTPNGPSGRSNDVTNRVLVWNGVLGPVLDQVARGGSR